MNKNTVITRTLPDGSFGFWAGGVRFSQEYPDARLLTIKDAKNVAFGISYLFPHCGVQIIRNYGEKNATGINF